MPVAEQFKALGAGNGFPSALTKIDLTSNQTLSGSTSLEDAMKAYWNVSRAQYKLTDINLAGGFTFNDSSVGPGSISYPEITPKKRVNGLIPDGSDGYVVYSTQSIDGDFDVEIVQTSIEPPKYALDGEGNRKYFHGIKFQYSCSFYGGYGSSDMAAVTFSSGPMLSPAGLTAANQNTSTALYSLVSDPTENLQDGFNTQFKETTQSLVNIAGLQFVKTVEFINDYTSPGSIGDATFHTTKNSISNASPNPSLEFYTYSQP